MFSWGFRQVSTGRAVFPCRTARGYRRASHGCQEAILNAGAQAGPSVAAALVAQSHFTSGAADKAAARNRERPGKFLEAERLSYVAAGRSALAHVSVLSVVADAVHVGQEDWLNVFLCDTSEDVSFVCPPQAGTEGRALLSGSEFWGQFLPENSSGKTIQKAASKVDHTKKSV